MDQFLHRLRLRSNRQVWLGTLAITLLAIAAPVGTLAVVLAPMANHSPSGYFGVLAIAGTIPLLIAPPISLFALSMLRLLTITIDRVDAQLRIDPLTGALVRAHFLDRVGDSLERDGPGSFLMIDADHFKSINDDHGHDAGDRALRVLGEVLGAAAPAGALVGRLGGEEFGVYLPGANAVAAAQEAERLCSAVRTSGRLAGAASVALTVSIGAACHEPGASLEATMKRADSALYQAKRSGRDRFYVDGAGATMPALLLRMHS